ncbi:MAG TPA: OmpH family outer membrane protein [Candidatus Avimuribaculum pullicola]|nr:OmpH family outer membrane protein [Candidatus Avimuribaculum pullicola]
MKLYRHLAKSVLVAAAIMMAVSCTNGTAGQAAGQAAASADTSTTGRMIIRYIDGDSLMANYNLAKEISEAMLRRSNQIDNEQQKRGAEITRFGNEIQNKYQNNGYLTQESFNADQAKLQQMQIDAQNYLAKLQRDAQNEMQQYNMQLNDSVENFINEYARQKGFDMIIYKASGVYMDAKYDVTDDVVNGLNKRYTKVEKK